MSEAYTLLEHESGGVRQTALLSENRLLEYTQEEAAGESLVGTLFLGRVERVLPQIKAAFVKLGLAQNGFLPIREQESFHQANGPAPLLTGQDVLVQVKKDPKGEKGAFLTRDVILPGQYVLLMPMNHHVGVSKRIEGEEDHARARMLGKKLSGGRIGVIVIAVLAAFLARDPETSIMSVVSFAWAGFGSAFGPIVLLALFWKRTTKNGALAGMVSGL